MLAINQFQNKQFSFLMAGLPTLPDPNTRDFELVDEEIKPGACFMCGERIGEDQSCACFPSRTAPATSKTAPKTTRNEKTNHVA